MPDPSGTITVCKLLRPTEWRCMQWHGVLHGSADDRRDGFVHLSTPAQLRATAAKWFGAEDALVLLAMDASVLGAALQWEPSGARGALFPHLYAPLPLHMVRAVMDIPRGADGTHAFPDDIP